MIQPVPLSKSILDGALALFDKVFVYERDRKIAHINFMETLERKNYGQMYWFATDKNGKAIGMTGLYRDQINKDDNETVWLGWFGVHPEYRKRGIGSSLLKFTINEAKSQGYPTMKIYTSTDENEWAAHKLYEDFGFNKINGSADREIIFYGRQL